MASIKDMFNSLISKVSKELQQGIISEDVFAAEVQNFLPNLELRGVALTCNFSVSVYDSDTLDGKVSFDGSKEPFKGKDETLNMGEVGVTASMVLAPYQVVNIPDNGYKFSNSVEMGYQVTAQVAELEPVEIKFWDYGDCYYTRKLHDFYNSQLDEQGLLKPGYNRFTCEIRDNLRQLVLRRCAVSRPKFEQASAQLALKMFSVTINYEDYDDYYLPYGEKSSYKMYMR